MAIYQHRRIFADNNGNILAQNLWVKMAITLYKSVMWFIDNNGKQNVWQSLHRLDFNFIEQIFIPFCYTIEGKI